QIHDADTGTVGNGQRHEQLLSIRAGTEAIGGGQPPHVQAAFQWRALLTETYQPGSAGHGAVQIIHIAIATAGPGPVAPAAGGIITDLVHAGLGQRRVGLPQAAGSEAGEQNTVPPGIEARLRDPLQAGQPPPWLLAAVEQAQPAALLVVA